MTTLARRAVFATVALAATLTPVNVEAEASMGAVAVVLRKVTTIDATRPTADRRADGRAGKWSLFIVSIVFWFV